MSHTLHFLPTPQPDESPASFLIRMAEGNGFSNVPQMILALAESQPVRLSSTPYTQVKLQHLFEAIGIDASFAVLAFDADFGCGPLTVFRRGKRDTNLWPDGTTFCPACLQQAPYFRRIWALKLYGACHLHGCFLVRRCPRCMETPSPTRGSLVQCRCGGVLTNAEMKPAEVDAYAWVYGLLGTGKLYAALNLYNKLVAMPGGNGSHLDITERLSVTWLWYTNKKAAIQKLTAIVSSRAHRLHPRVQLQWLIGPTGDAARLARDTLVLIGETIPASTSCPGTVSRLDASHILGLSPTAILTLQATGALEKGNQISLKRLHWLLNAVMRSPTSSSLPSFRIPSHIDLCSVIRSICSGAITSSGYQLATGLSSLTVTRCLRGPRDLYSTMLDVHCVSSLLGEAPVVVRSLVKAGNLVAETRTGVRQEHVLISPNSVQQFQRSFVTHNVLADHLARSGFSHDMRSALVSELHHSSVSLSGGAETTLYRRESLPDRLLRVGSPPDNKIYSVFPIQPLPGVSYLQAAAKLSISLPHICSLVRHHMLTLETEIQRGARISSASLNLLEAKLLSAKFIPLSRAAQICQCSLRQFQKLYVEEMDVPITDLHLWKLVEIDLLLDALHLKGKPIKDFGDDLYSTADRRQLSF